MKRIVTSAFILMLLLSACKMKSTIKGDAFYWRLGWRMIESSMIENYELSSEQFDSLRREEGLPYDFMATGLRSMFEIGESKKATELFSSLDLIMQIHLCEKDYLMHKECCKAIPAHIVGNEHLQRKILKMYVMDQSVRGNVMGDLIKKYQLDTVDYNFSYSTDVDLNNQLILNDIIEKYGFPSKNLVGKDALRGVFFIIQHADSNAEWQKEQFPFIKAAVSNGDLDARKYAYLYDRIQVNAKLPQLYGTQFSNVDSNGAILYTVHNEKELDLRRMEIGLMPIDMYKRLMMTD